MWANRVEPNPGVLEITVIPQVVGRGEDGDAVLAHPLGHAELRLDAGHQGAIPQWLSRIKQLHTAMRTPSRDHTGVPSECNRLLERQAPPGSALRTTKRVWFASDNRAVGTSGLRPPASLQEWMDSHARQNSDFAKVSKRCPVCASPARADIDALIVTGWSEHDIAGLFNSFLGSPVFTETQVALHARRHVSGDDPTTAEHLERAADLGHKYRPAKNQPDTPQPQLSAQDTKAPAADHRSWRGRTGDRTRCPRGTRPTRAIELQIALDASDLGLRLDDYDRFKEAVRRCVSDDLWTEIERAHRRSKAPAKTTLFGEPER